MCHACWFEEWSMLQFWQHFYLASFGSSHRSTIKWSGPGPNLENLQNVSWPVITHSVPLFVKVSWCAWYNTFGTFLHMAKQCRWCHGGPHNVRRYPKKRPAAARKRIGGDTSHTLILACGLSASHVGDISISITCMDCCPFMMMMIRDQQKMGDQLVCEVIFC